MAQQETSGKPAEASPAQPAKKGLSSKLMQLKFMQRATERQAQANKTDQDAQQAETAQAAPAAGSRKGFIIIQERDPLPGYVGRRSFGGPKTEDADAANTSNQPSTVQGANAAAGVTVTDQDLAKAFKRPAESKTLSMALQPADATGAKPQHLQQPPQQQQQRQQHQQQKRKDDNQPHNPNKHKRYF